MFADASVAAVGSGKQRARTAIDTGMDEVGACDDLHRHVLATSPVGSILERPIVVTTTLVTPSAA